ncbi:MAG: exodeoxyribonuclease III [Candidatus Magnetoglobus multicellularis str. Araruama]|uniref:Exodeoxyribonuclease III n=1 Tax=Candidatus Magnetoglobus multicellularis str. Araruama TaxID=890399 RepID=A0A1V1PAJ6_9BACT|nr:MAG: exodeoxyribonuclease III [Candidatus Magnetoglobus multicellularis str. Araruama]
MPSQKLISWNVNGIRAVEKKGFIETVSQLNPDIIGIQETKAQKDQLSNDLLTIDGYHSFWNSAEKKGYSGVAVYTKKSPLSVFNGIDSPAHDQEGRAITLEYERFYLINLYFPNAQDKLKRIDYKIEFNEAFLAYVNQIRQNKTVVICGDFNVAHKPIDLANPKRNENNAGYSPKERAWFTQFIEAGYVDTFREFNTQPEQYTWWSYRFKAREKNIGWRIDYFCVDKNSLHRVKNACIYSDILGSDHCPVGISFQSD